MYWNEWLKYINTEEQKKKKQKQKNHPLISSIYQLTWRTGARKTDSPVRTNTRMPVNLCSLWRTMTVITWQELNTCTQVLLGSNLGFTVLVKVIWAGTRTAAPVHYWFAHSTIWAAAIVSNVLHCPQSQNGVTSLRGTAAVPRERWTRSPSSRSRCVQWRWR